MMEPDTLEIKCTMKVLTVDDSEIVRERLKAILFEVAKVETISQAKDRQEATGLLRDLNPGVMVLDIQMPGGSRMDLLRKKGGERSRENNAPDNR